jgi:hypothetical protein
VTGSTFQLHPLVFQEEPGGVTIGRTDIDSYGVFPPDGAALVRRLLDGSDPAEAARWYEGTYGDPVDLDDFLATLEELAFLRHDLPDAGSPPAPAPVPGRRVGDLLFSRGAGISYVLLVAAAVVTCWRHPELSPQPGHVFFSSYLLPVALVLAFGQVPLILVHELFHLFAARRLGVRARIRLSHRLYFVVFETKMDGLVAVPRRARYLPIVAGMLADLMVAAVLVLGADLLWSVAGTGARICLALAFTTLLRTAMETMLFLRTDLYFLATTVAGCVDLHTTSREMVTNQVWRVLGRRERLRDPERWDPRDRAAARWYVPLHLAGYGVALVLLVTVMVPITWRFLAATVTGLLHPSLGPAHFWDALGVLVLNGAQPAVAGLLALRERFLSRPRPPHQLGKVTS